MLSGLGHSLTKGHITVNVRGHYEDRIQHTYKNAVVVLVSSGAHEFLYTTT